MKKLFSAGNITIIALFVVIFLYAFIRKCNRQQNPEFTWGISKGLSKSVKGNIILDYVFSVNGEKIEGFVPQSFCGECPSCCIAGDTVIVRYESGNPQNNDLVVKLPDGESLQ